ncbi:conserved membrane hypothetical protein [Hyella patelloides LEGE 07179]|uniref:Uncharacterized protein n=1 Tax=Hyella patelloides LEGE 07179 TaxID=945734 RepID=A0A563VMT6_9CYAN|nr:hypothetical protein [Hyella patelloides]VEP12643.1 conserved membrane hypothetical protein [Hyella patelloides LEGE 07179]
MYYFPQPPVFLPVIGLLIGLIFGVTFQKQLEQITPKWIKNPKDKNAYTLNDRNLQISYTGICLGVWLFLGGGFRVLGFGIISAYGVALLLAIGTGAFMWQQFGEMLIEVQEKGVKSLDLDKYID